MSTILSRLGMLMLYIILFILVIHWKYEAIHDEDQNKTKSNSFSSSDIKLYERLYVIIELVILQRMSDVCHFLLSFWNMITWNRSDLF